MTCPAQCLIVSLVSEDVFAKELQQPEVEKLTKESGDQAWLLTGTSFSKLFFIMNGRHYAMIVDRPDGLIAASAIRQGLAPIDQLFWFFAGRFVISK